MASKYKNESSSIYIDGTDVPKNKFNLTNSTQIRYAIDCVQYADESGFEKTILNGLNKI
ncbi:MAG: hypothetical protein U9R16_08625 [Campylobacterota bacterium]|nr:hypothetical protein [Campylobacterota bacterium]